MKPPFRPSIPAWPSLTRFDTVSLSAIAFLGGLITLNFFWGQPSPLRVTYHSWQNQKIGVNDRILKIDFNHPIGATPLNQYLTITPELAGQMTWQGKSLFYTLTAIPRYGTNYQVQLQSPATANNSRPLESFTSLVNTHNRSFLYLGIAGEERGRLILFDLTDAQKPKKTILTPKDLQVRQFQVYPQGDRVLLIAADPSQSSPRLDLFTVTTGINPLESPQNTAIPGRLERLLAEDGYDTLQIALASRGEGGVLLRRNRQNPVDTGLWAFLPPATARPLGIKAEQFVLSPQGTHIAVAQTGGVSVVPLLPQGGGTQFWAGYERPLAFTPDGTELLLSQVDANYTFSLQLKNLAAPTQKEILRSPYPIQSCQFDPVLLNHLYCLKTEMVPQADNTLQEETFLVKLDRHRGKSNSLLALPNYPDVQLTLAPDGSGLLLDQVATTPAVSPQELLTPSQQAIADGRIWLLPLLEPRKNSTTPAVVPQELTVGFAPQWMP